LLGRELLSFYSPIAAIFFATVDRSDNLCRESLHHMLHSQQSFIIIKLMTLLTVRVHMLIILSLIFSCHLFTAKL
jgi:hypothetical protein